MLKVEKDGGSGESKGYFKLEIFLFIEICIVTERRFRAKSNWWPKKTRITKAPSKEIASK